MIVRPAVDYPWLLVLHYWAEQLSLFAIAHSHAAELDDSVVKVEAGHALFEGFWVIERTNPLLTSQDGLREVGVRCYCGFKQIEHDEPGLVDGDKAIDHEVVPYNLSDLAW